MRITARARERDDGTWTASVLDGAGPHAEAGSPEACLDALAAELPAGDGPLVVEVVPRVVGVAEAAALMGWDKRRVITYLDRGSFPEPLQALASGRIWLREDVERFARDWHERQRMRRERRSHARADR